MENPQRESMAQLLFDSGNKELQAGRAQSALNFFKQSLSYSPHNPDIHTNMGIALDLLKDTQGALNAFGNAYLIEPGNRSIAENLVHALIRAGKSKTAVQIALKPSAILRYPTVIAAIRHYLASPESSQDPEVHDQLVKFDELVKGLGLHQNSAERDLFLLANYKHRRIEWIELSLGQLSDDDFYKWVKVKGIDKIHECQAEGRGGIILSSHTTSAHTILLALIRHGLRLNSIEWNNRYAAFPIRGIENVNFLEVGKNGGFALREVYLARNALQRGELLQTTGDGYQGKSELLLDFLGRKRPFRRSFAELSIMTGVPVFPVFCTMSLDGVIEIDIKPALHRPDSIMPMDSQVTTLVSEYAALLEVLWKTKTANIAWPHINRFLFHRFDAKEN